MTEYGYNQNFTEKYLGQTAVKITNSFTRTIEKGELVYISPWFGNALEDIAASEEGYIDINHNREISTEQIEETDTFTVGGVMYFDPGSNSAAGKLVDAVADDEVAVGTITDEQGTGGAQTSVQFRPYLQKGDLSGLDTRLTAAEGDIDDLETAETAMKGTGWTTENLKENADAIAALEVDAATAQATIPIPLAAITQEDGTPLAKLNSTASGFSQIGNKELVISMPIDATIEALGFSVPVPQDLDDSEDITIHVLAGKDADNDVLTLDCEVYPCAAGDVANADIQDTAATAITAAASELVFTCGTDGVLAAPGTLTAILTLGGTNDGDAVYIYGAWVEYTKKVMTA
jgi:hypothetical protein